MIIKAIIVDDDLKSRNLIHGFCDAYSNDKIAVVAQCDSVDSAVLAIQKYNPNLVFLDIDMPEKNGFELVNHFSTIPFEIVFVTGHANQFTKAIEISALNYLMKPINPLNIKSIVERFENKMELANNINRFEVLKSNLNSDKKSIVFPNNDGFKVALVSDIISCETENGNGKCKIETTKETIVVTKSLKEMLQLLPETIFIKVSGSAIINKKMVELYNSKDFNLRMNNGRTIKVSEKFYNKTELMDAISN
ncbi:LytR/AlgR family response regulator transcription factor [Flavobacterium yafengii]|uniref:LytR/AlgR family response regulator transcription factor n=1 Tax=Flavobacterium yafengii TaxID=3041253 RepID=UPI0024A92515|nr:LytTR family DNA-binding domain-containing protein [Flavobacterium yafengii]MDI5897512.1 LytTR family DNA-binding domain-containing protein [Flavobacterium yafengii]